MECYNLELDEWSICVGFDIFRCWVGCVVIEFYIYIVGGGISYNRNIIFFSVERYDLDKDFWFYVVYLREVRLMLGCVFWGDKIYVIGGIDLSGV